MGRKGQLRLTFICRLNIEHNKRN